MVSWQMIKIYVPLSVLTLVLKETGFLNFISPFLAPLMKIMGLPGEAAISLIAAGTNGIYGGIATMAAFDLSFRQVTILGVVLGFSHNLIVETGILMKLKFANFRIFIFRIILGIASGIVMNLLLPDKISGAIINPYAKVVDFTWIAAIRSILTTCTQIVLLILVLNISYESLKKWRYIQSVKKKISVIPNSLGLSEQAFVPWMVGFVFGIVYGAGIMFQFKEKNEITHKDACLITVFLCLAHAIVEDTVLFWLIGGNLWYIIPIRVMMAIIIVKILSINEYYKKLWWLGFGRLH